MTVSKSFGVVNADARIQDKVNLLFAGTVITNGRGLAIVSDRIGSSSSLCLPPGCRSRSRQKQRHSGGPIVRCRPTA